MHSLGMRLAGNEVRLISQEVDSLVPRLFLLDLVASSPGLGTRLRGEGVNPLHTCTVGRNSWDLKLGTFGSLTERAGTEERPMIVLRFSFLCFSNFLTDSWQSDLGLLMYWNQDKTTVEWNRAKN